jgi:alpha-N-arabinofuranosidase
MWSMNRKLHFTAYLMTVLAACMSIVEIQAQHKFQGDDKRRTTPLIKPVIPGFNPDPSICRAGDDYYIVTSSNEYFPGLPVWHSRDLVAWSMIGHVLSNPAHLDLDSIPGSSGLYAPTIRYHDGLFYVVCTLTGTRPGKPRGNFITTARDPRGPWSAPVWMETPGIDPSLFFDEDGKVYYQGNYTPEDKKWARHRKIYLQEIDLKQAKLIGPKVDILDAADYHLKGTIDGGFESGADYLEAPHLYKKDGYYYLTTSHGGTFQYHALSFWRSRNIFGPYESNPANPILTHRSLPPTHPVTSTGHGDLVMDAQGQWHMTFLARRPLDSNIHILGRETFLTRIEWTDGWPRLPRDLTLDPTLQDPDHISLPKDDTSIRRTTFPKGDLSPEWTFIRTPREKWWAVSGRKGSVTLRLRPERISETTQPSWLGIRQDRFHARFSSRMKFKPKQTNEEAGLTVFRDKDHYFKYTLIRKEDGDILQLTSRRIGDPEDILIARVPYHARKVVLRVSSSGQWYSFEYGSPGSTMRTLQKDVDGAFLGSPAAGRFTGTMMGLYATGNGSRSGNSAYFDRIQY